MWNNAADGKLSHGYIMEMVMLIGTIYLLKATERNV